MAVSNVDSNARSRSFALTVPTSTMSMDLETAAAVNKLIRLTVKLLQLQRYLHAALAHVPPAGAAGGARSDGASGGNGSSASGTVAHHGDGAHQGSEDAPKIQGPAGAVPTVAGSTGQAADATVLAANVPDGFEQYRSAVNAASVRTGVPANRIAATIWAESRATLNDPISTRNSDGTTDHGLMQIGQERYDTVIRAEVGGPPLDVRNSADNIMAGAFALSKNYKVKGNWTDAHKQYVGIGDQAGYAAAVNGYAASMDAGQSMQNGSGF